MKDISKVAFIVQARLNSQRVPQKMVRPFAGTTLFDLVLDKLLASSIIPKENIIASVYDPPLFDIALKKRVRIFNRSELSANTDDDLRIIYEWHDKLKEFDYVVLISGCNPLLRDTTIDRFVKQFIDQKEENLFAVMEKKQYYWNKEGKLITPWPEDQTIMNTKAVEPTYEAAHVLYASRLDIINDYRFMGDFQAEGGIKLMTMPELEAFDIDYEWQFKVGETLYNETKG
jgi:CMP-N-acetylneuraminic acid synthetase